MTLFFSDKNYLKQLRSSAGCQVFSGFLLSFGTELVFSNMGDIMDPSLSCHKVSYEEHGKRRYNTWKSVQMPRFYVPFVTSIPRHTPYFIQSAAENP